MHAQRHAEGYSRQRFGKASFGEDRVTVDDEEGLDVSEAHVVGELAQRSSLIRRRGVRNRLNKVQRLAACIQ